LNHYLQVCQPLVTASVLSAQCCRNTLSNLTIAQYRYR